MFACGNTCINSLSTQINAETTAGGLALWSTSLVEGDVRVNTTSWNAAYQPYAAHIIESVKPNQVTEGGPILRELRLSCIV